MLKPKYLDTLVASLILLGGLYLYGSTLAPTVLEGDAALFQFTPHVLGVTYPTGFPLYILLGKLWLMVVPFGEIAWRMSLFSAVCGALALPLLYQISWRLQVDDPSETIDLRAAKFWLTRLSALLCVSVFATLPVYWRWATSAKTYTLNILLLALMLFLLIRHVGQRRAPIYWTALLLGLSISVHNTMILLIPGIALFILLHYRAYLNLKTMFLSGLLLALPLAIYLYIPLRAEWLIAEHGRTAAIQHGLVADFYQSGWQGWRNYFSAKEFMQGVAADWGEVPTRFGPVYGQNLLADEVGNIGMGLGLVGCILMLLTKPRYFTPLLLIYTVPIPFVLAYGRGQQNAFLLPSFMIFCLFIGHVSALISLVPRHQTWSTNLTRLLHVAFLVVCLLLIPAYLLPRFEYGFNWLDNKWTEDIRLAWEDALAHPLEPEAGLLAEWADLTPFWYLQHAEQNRPDLRGIYPPTEETTITYLETGQSLYIAGLVDTSRPERQWMIGLDERYQLIPWGRLVKIAPLEAEPQSLLPHLTYQYDVVFADNLHLREADFAPQAHGGTDYHVNLTWQTRRELPPETIVSLRLTQGNSIVAQLDDSLLSGWFPRETLPAEQYLLSAMPIPIPLGTLPGTYQLQLVVYAHHSQPWAMADGQTVLNLGEVVIPPSQTAPVWVDEADFNGEFLLTEYDYSVTRVGQGKGFAVTMLWQARHQPEDNYKLRVELVTSAGEVVRTMEHYPPLPTAQWQTGQYVRDLVNLVLPASTPPGEEALFVRLSWLRPDGSTLNARQWGVPWGEFLDLKSLTVTEKKDRRFEIPPLDQQIEADFEGKLRLMGWNLATDERCQTEASSTVRCQPDTALALELVWQGQTEMAELYTVFLHVVDENGQVISQMDKVPGIRGKQPTTGWLPQEVILDPISVLLPSDLPTEAYTLRVGLYLPPDGPRMLVVDEQGQPLADFVDIGRLVVE